MYKPEEKKTDCNHREAPRSDVLKKKPSFCPQCKSLLLRHPDETKELEKLLSSPHASRKQYQPKTISLKNWEIMVEELCHGPIEVGVKEINKIASKQFGCSLKIKDNLKTETLSGKGNRIIVLRGNESKTLSLLARQGKVDISHNKTGYDGFLVQYIDAIDNKSKECIIIWGYNERGAMYGCLLLAELIKKGKLTNELDARETPYFKLRGGPMGGESNMLLPEVSCATYRPTDVELLGLVNLRANLITLRYNLASNHDEYLTLKYMDEVTNTPPDKIEKNILDLKKDIKLAKKYGLQVGLQMSMWHDSYATQEIFEKHPDARAKFDQKFTETYRSKFKNKYNRMVCPSHPLFKKVIDAEIRELFERFPEVDFIYTWGNSDGMPLWCECEKCVKYPSSQRQADYQSFLYKTIKKYKPEASYVMGWPTLEMYGDKIFRKLPKGIYFTCWNPGKTGEAEMAKVYKDPLTEKLGNRYFPQFSRHTEAFTSILTPDIRISGMKTDFMQYVNGVTPGVMEHRPFMIANFGSPEKYFDISEPLHVAWFKFAWNPFSSADEILENWARDRFPDFYQQVLQIYRYFDEIPCKGISSGRGDYPARSIGLLSWKLFYPELSKESTTTNIWENGILLDKEAPYGYRAKARNYYLFEKKLRSIEISMETLSIWVERFDFVSFAEKAENIANELKLKFPENRHLPRLCLSLHALTIYGKIYRDYMEAGLRYCIALDMHGEEQKAEFVACMDLLKKCMQNALDYLASPTSISLNWSRWATHRNLLGQLKEEWQRVNKEFPSKDLNFEELINSMLNNKKDPYLGIGLEPDKEKSTEGYRLIDISKHFNTSFKEKFPLLPDPEFYKKFDYQYWECRQTSFNDIPRGLQWIWNTPFILGGRYNNVSEKDYIILRRDTPSKTLSIKINDSLLEINFLISMMGHELPDKPIAEISVLFKNDRKETVPIRRWSEVTSLALPEATPIAKMGWIDMGKDRPFATGFNYFKWVNSSPEEKISELIISARESNASLMLFGITGKMNLNQMKRS